MDETTDDPYEDVQILTSIIRLLLSLADLADRAAGYPRAICAIILWILRPAEAAASAYAVLAPDALQAPFARSGNARDDARRLAVRLRILADELMCEAEFTLSFATVGTRCEVRDRPTPLPLVKHTLVDILDRCGRIAVLARLEPVDTS